MRFSSDSIFSFFIVLFLISCQNEKGQPPQNTGKVQEELIAPENAQFERLSSEQTGVRFSNNISENHEVNIITNSYMYNGGGVAILDVNNDGLQDIFFTSSQESNRLYLNKGGLNFQDITQTAKISGLGGFTTGVSAADVNNDGLLDIYVCRSGLNPSEERRNLLFINNGDLTFSEKGKEYGLADISASNHANFFDYDLDGDLDVYVINHPVIFSEVNKISVQQLPSGYKRNTEPRDEYESDKLFRNNGDGTFTDVSLRAGINNRAWSLSVTVSDFNNDGYPDIFVGNDYIEPDWLYINNKNGTFSIKTDDYFRHMSNHTMGVDIADINNDGNVDLVALDMIAEGNKRQKALMTTMVLERYQSLLRFGYGHQIMRNVLQVNNGNGTFSEIGTLAGISNTDWSWACLLADYDNDTRKDLYITNGYRRDVTNLDYLNYTVDSINRLGGLGNFKDIEDYLQIVPTEKLQNYMFHNQGNLNLKKVNTEWGFVDKSYSNGAAYADLDNDGDLEIIVNNIHEEAFIYKNRSKEQGSSNHLQIKLVGSNNNKFGVGTKVTIHTGEIIQFQELNPIRGFFSSVEPIFHFGLGKHESIDRIEIIWPDGKSQILENISANQKLIVNYEEASKRNISTNSNAETIFKSAQNLIPEFKHIENEFLDFNRERLLPHQLSKLGPSIATADINGDSLEDFYVGGAVNQVGAIFIQNSNSTFKLIPQEAFNADSKFEDLDAIFFDVEGDGDQDLFVVSGGSIYSANSDNYQDRLYLNDGQGNFSRTVSALPKITSSTACIALNDYDGDNDLDIFLGGRHIPGRYPTSPQSYVLENEGGSFKDVTKEVSPEFQNLGMVTGLAWANIDGLPGEELVVVGEWLPVSVFKKEAKQLKNITTELGLQNTSGWWNCLETGDFDKDGDIDLVAGNLGLNTRLKASEKKPLTLYANDFDNNGSIDPILTQYEGGRLFPLPQRDMMIKQLPHLKKKYVRFENYATASISDVFSKSELDAAQKLEAKTLATSYFQNDGNGNFTLKTLSVEAQFAPCFRILAEDLNNDGNLDILMVGNSYATEVETGRYDAANGTLLFGDGTGKFIFSKNQENGFWATKESRDIAKIKLANDKDLFLIANNDDILQAYIK